MKAAVEAEEPEEAAETEAERGAEAAASVGTSSTWRTYEKSARRHM